MRCRPTQEMEAQPTRQWPNASDAADAASACVAGDAAETEKKRVVSSADIDATCKVLV